MEKIRVPLFTLDPSKINWKFKLKRSDRRLKLYIKMNKAETDQWDALRDAIKPPDVADNEFAKVLFFRGIESFMTQLTDRINSMTEEEKQGILEQSGLEASSLSFSGTSETTND